MVRRSVNTEEAWDGCGPGAAVVQEPLPDRKGVLEMPYSPTSSRTSRIRRVLLRESGNTQENV